jgi:hypothetical protein
VRECSRSAIVDKLIEEWLRGTVWEPRYHRGTATVGRRTWSDARRHIAIQQAFAHRPLVLCQGDDHAAPSDFGVAIDALLHGVLVPASERKSPASVKELAKRDSVSAVPRCEEADDGYLDLFRAARS